jgi:hypothetical protein
MTTAGVLISEINDSKYVFYPKMKLFLQGTTILGLLIANASAAKSGLFAANGVELEMYQSGELLIIGVIGIIPAPYFAVRSQLLCVGNLED